MQLSMRDGLRLRRRRRVLSSDADRVARSRPLTNNSGHAGLVEDHCDRSVSHSTLGPLSKVCATPASFIRAAVYGRGYRRVVFLFAAGERRYRRKLTIA